MKGLLLLLQASCLVFGGPLSDEDVPPLPEDGLIPTSKFGSRLYGLPDPEAGKLLEGLDVTQQNPEEVGPYFEGDVLIPGLMPKNGIAGDAYRWPGGRIPYVIDSSFSANGLDLIYKAFQAYHANTCIRFEPRTASDYNYISIEKHDSGCWSSVGMTGRGKQTVNLQEPGCTTLPGTSVHELMHAVGFMHEQNRGDRDEYISVNYENVRQGLESNFDKYNSLDPMGIQYDYGSVMHYGLSSFSKNGRPTMTALKSTNSHIGQRVRMSQIDIQKINTMYNCPGTQSAASPYGGFFGNAFGLIESVMKQDGEEHLNGD